MQGRLSAILFLALLAAMPPVAAQQQAPVASLPAEGKRLELMQREKLRLTTLRRKLVKEKASPLELFKQLNGGIAKGNFEQFKANNTLVVRCEEYRTEAERRRLPERVQQYNRLIQLYRQYARLNEAVVKAYNSFDSGAFNKSLAEIEQLEPQILALGGTISREWFFPSELAKVPLPGQQPAAPKTPAPPRRS